MRVCILGMALALSVLQGELPRTPLTAVFLLHVDVPPCGFSCCGNSWNDQQIHDLLALIYAPENVAQLGLPVPERIRSGFNQEGNLVLEFDGLRPDQAEDVASGCLERVHARRRFLQVKGMQTPIRFEIMGLLYCGPRKSCTWQDLARPPLLTLWDLSK
jgi:hypothetical protein